MAGRVVFADVIGIVAISWSPINLKLALAYSVSDPVEAHVESFGCFLLDAIVGEAYCSRVVDLYWCWRLRVAEFIECNSKREGISSGEEGGCDFCFRRGAHYVGEDF